MKLTSVLSRSFTVRCQSETEASSSLTMQRDTTSIGSSARQSEAEASGSSMMQLDTTRQLEASTSAARRKKVTSIASLTNPSKPKNVSSTKKTGKRKDHPELYTPLVQTVSTRGKRAKSTVK